MIRTLLVFLLLVRCAFADTYHFTEIRYSDATELSTQLEGEIDFHEHGLDIKYPKSARELKYKNNTLVYLEENKEIALEEVQASQIMQYFDVLILLHNGDESELQEIFEIHNSAEKTLLKPKGTLKYYIDTIELFQEQKRLKRVKLFLKNNDEISIDIDDEIR